ncbi:hypothetical protein [Lysobacter gummosus]|uniref:hypothetical protein n=1 Tax=Lysobacter gummosus TaxID=262324 RepID=UPI00363DE4BE
MRSQWFDRRSRCVNPIRRAIAATARNGESFARGFGWVQEFGAVWMRAGLNVLR